ncbi:hypothetical protein BpHYR1_007920, partial [Brachionus plicatilis]
YFYDSTRIRNSNYREKGSYRSRGHIVYVYILRFNMNGKCEQLFTKKCDHEYQVVLDIDNFER